ncbi:hypothetical protein QFC21_006649 [Naganishia friedmannii]|uniref:Uncharacterized protein n=1 Tax=Naganishia friedmannii TaxID=89922 RepID=A0ACC2V1G8_9TREE|nr:hypothetical protein QFC21_006649 [Naganishia friedmannii]
MLQDGQQPQLLRQMRDMAVEFEELIASTLAVENEAQFDGFESADQLLSTWLATFRQRPVYNNEREMEICRRSVSAAFGEEWWIGFGWRGSPQGKTFLATLRTLAIAARLRGLTAQDCANIADRCRNRRLLAYGTSKVRDEDRTIVSVDITRAPTLIKPRFIIVPPPTSNLLTTQQLNTLSITGPAVSTPASELLAITGSSFFPADERRALPVELRNEILRVQPLVSVRSMPSVSSPSQRRTIANPLAIMTASPSASPRPSAQFPVARTLSTGSPLGTPSPLTSTFSKPLSSQAPYRISISHQHARSQNTQAPSRLTLIPRLNRVPEGEIHQYPGLDGADGQDHLMDNLGEDEGGDGAGGARDEGEG